MIMQPPSVESWIEVLQNCRRKKQAAQAKSVYAYMQQQHLDLHPVLANYLIPTLVDCGRLDDARKVFNSLPHHQLNEHSWLSLISGYTGCAQLHHALELFFQMQCPETDSVVQPDRITYLTLLTGCARLKEVDPGRRIHAELTKRGLETGFPCGSHSLGNTIVDMYGKCGMLMEGRHVFNRLPVRDTVSWASLIARYTENGLGEEATNFFREMLLEKVSPNLVACICSLKACSTVQALARGLEIHMEIIKRGFEGDLEVGNMLVDFYGKCGSLAEAYCVFHKLPGHDAVSWSALIAGRMEHGQVGNVGKLLRRMLMEGVTPDSVAFVCILKACADAQAWETGLELHDETIKRGLERELRVGNSLMAMYVECHLLVEACQVFNRLLFQDTVSWNTLIAGFANYGMCEEIQSCSQQMLLEAIPPDSLTFVWILKACGETGNRRMGEETHAELVKWGFEREPHVGSMLVDMYVAHDSLADAYRVFESLPFRNAVAWNTILAGYAKHGLNSEIGQYFEQMRQEGISPSPVTFICILKACIAAGELSTGLKVHVEITKRGCDRELLVGSMLVDMYSVSGLLTEAHQVLDRLVARNAVSWNSLMAGYIGHGLDKETGNSFQQMQLDGISITSVTFLCSLKACSTMGALEAGLEIHTEITKRGCEKELYVGSALVYMYGKCGLLGEARQVFDLLPFRSTISWNTIIKAYGMNHQGNMALQCFQDMQEQGVRPSSMTFVCLLAACSHSNLVPEGQECFKSMAEEHDIEPLLDHYASMIDLFARSGHVYEAEGFVAAMQCPPSSMILRDLLSACKMYGEVDVGQSCFQKLVKANQEDSAAYLLMADTYANAGRWMDIHRLEEFRKYMGANKKPGIGSIEVNRQLHEFVVGFKPSEGIIGMLGNLSSRMKDGGYVPILDLVTRAVYHDVIGEANGWAPM